TSELSMADAQGMQLLASAPAFAENENPAVLEGSLVRKTSFNEPVRNEGASSKTNFATRDSSIAPGKEDVVAMKTEQIFDERYSPIRLEENGSWQEALSEASP